MILAEVNLSLEPVWPWSTPNAGLPGMLAIALVLAGLTVSTYLGVRGATMMRILALLALRLFALILAFCMMMRPSVGMTHLDGVETSKLLVVWDASESMNVADGTGKSTRWEQIGKLWSSRPVQRRLRELADEQKITVVKYLATDELRPDEPDASASGKRTDIGVWLHQLWQQHGHEKQLRGIAIFSDGGDNGTLYSAQEKARRWRGVCPIQAFGVGNPHDARFARDIALTKLQVDPSPVAMKAKMKIKAVAQAPGFEKTEVEVSLRMENVAKKEAKEVPNLPKFVITRTKNQEMVVTCDAPDEPGEYKVTMKVKPLPEETNKDNNEISTFVQVVKEKIVVLWVDRPRVYEPTFALRYALGPEKRFQIHYAEPPTDKKGDPVAWYDLEKKHYDVIVIGDVTAKQFSGGDPKIFDKIKEMIELKKTGLLMLGGEETFGKGGWQTHPAWMDLMPVTFDKGEFLEREVRALPAKEGMPYPFLQLDPEPKRNHDIWTKQFEPLEGLAPLGKLKDGSTEMLKGPKGEMVMAARMVGKGYVAVFAGDTTSRSWFGKAEAVRGYKRFWKQLVYWLAQQDDISNPLWVKLDRRQIGTGAADLLGFTFGLQGKTGAELSRAKFKAMVTGPKAANPREHVVHFSPVDQHQKGTFQGAKERGEYQLIIEGKGKDLDGSEVEGKAVASFVVDSEEVEMLRPAADHDLLGKIADAADGRFFLAEEQPLLAYLDELKSQVNSEARLKTTHWPDWKRLPSSDHARDQLSGLWNSFSLGGFVLFVILLGAEWFLRRWWGLV